MSFDVEQGNDLATQDITGSITGVSEPVQVIIAYTNVGVGNASFEFTGSHSGLLRLTPRPWESLAPGTYRDTVTISACFDSACTRHVPGSPRQVAVSYTIRAAVVPALLHLSQRGVSLATVGGRQRLSHGLIVRDTSPGTPTWTATSDSAWLGVTPSGSSGATLALNADAAAVAALPEGQHLALVTVRSSNPNLPEQTVRVGLYHQLATGPTALAEPTLAGSVPFDRRLVVAVDPVLPIRYASVGDRIVLDHIHTGARVASISIPGADLRDVVVADDGIRLYGVDAAARQIVTVDLTTRQVLARQNLTGASQGDWRGLRAAFARIGAAPSLLLSSAVLDSAPGTTVTPVIDPQSGSVRGRVYGFSGWSFTTFAATGGAVVYAADAGLTGGGLSTHRIELTVNSSGRVYGTSRSTPGASVSSGLMDFAASPDGLSVVNAYFADSVPLRATFVADTLQWTPVAGGSLGFHALGDANVEFAADGRWLVIAGAQALRLYAANNTVLQTLSSGLPPEWGSFQSRGMVKWSSDGLRLVGETVLFDMP